MNIYFVRHTEVAKESSDWIAGRTDIDLTQNGVLQAKLLAQRLTERIPFDAFFSSPLKRCLHLAEEIKNRSQKVFQIDSRLSECDFGEWEGKRLNLLYEQDPEMDLFSPPGGESVEQVVERVLHFWNEVILKLKAENVLIVAHGGVNSAAVMGLIGTPKEKFWDCMQSYGGVNHLKILKSGAVHLMAHNDLSFMNGAL